MVVSKVPDFNKIGFLSRYNAETWNLVSTEKVQSFVPTRDFGSELPMKDGDSIVCHCANHGDVFLALASRLDAEFTVSDIRASSLRSVILKAREPYARLAIVADGLAIKLGECKRMDIVKEATTAFLQDAEQIGKRKIEYLAGDSSYLGIPTKSVDWAFTYEPLIFGNLPFVVEMLASARKGVIFAFSEGNRRNISDLDLKKFDYFSGILYEYGLATRTLDSTFNAIGEGVQNIRYIISETDSELPDIDRKMFNYCANNIFPVPKKTQLDRYAQIVTSPKDYVELDLHKAGYSIQVSEEQIAESIQRISRMMNRPGCDTPYSYVKVDDLKIVGI